MKEIFKLFEKALSGWGILLTAMLALTVIATVFMRYIFSITFIWSEELITFLFIATTFFGIGLAVKEEGHISISYFIERVPPAAQYWLKAINSLLIIFLQVFVIFFGLQWIGVVGNDLSPGFRVPLRYIYFMLIIGSALLAVFQTGALIRLFNPEKPVK